MSERTIYRKISHYVKAAPYQSFPGKKQKYSVMHSGYWHRVED